MKANHYIKIKRVECMKKTLLLLLSILLLGTSVYAAVGKETKGPFGYNLYDDITRKPNAKSAKQDNESAKVVKEFYGDSTIAEWETEEDYYPEANLESAVNKYKNGNYSGCLQEMISLTKIDPYNPVVYYYMGMAYTQVGKKDQAVKAYEQVIKLQPDKTLIQYATKGRDCLVGGPTCNADEQSADSKLDSFINSPYGNGFSEELNQQVKQKQLQNIQKTINKKQELEQKDIEKIQKFDQKSENITGEKLASSQVSNEEVLSAIQTLKDAGLTFTVNNPMLMPMNNQFNEYSMLLGNNNNNNAMMNMVPFLLNQHQNGQKIDPQIIQAMMMNSMLPDFTFNDNNKNY